MTKPAEQHDLFAAEPPAPALPEGFLYEREFLTREEEASLIASIRELPFTEAKYREFTARRRTVSYGGQYDFSRNRLDEAPDIPPFLFPLREKVAGWAGIEPTQF